MTFVLLSRNLTFQAANEPVLVYSLTNSIQKNSGWIPVEFRFDYGLIPVEFQLNSNRTQPEPNWNPTGTELEPNWNPTGTQPELE